MAFKEHSSIGKAATALLDALLVTVSFYGAYEIFVLRWQGVHDRPPGARGMYLWLIFVFAPVLLALLNHYGLLVVRRSRSERQVITRCAKAFLLTGVVLSGVIFLTKAKYYSRFLLATHWALAFLLVLSEKLILRVLARKGVLKLGGVRAAVLVGEGEKAGRMRRLLERDPGRWLDPEAIFDLSVGRQQFQEYLLNHPADEVYFALPRREQEPGLRIDDYLRFCERLGVPARVILNLGDIFEYFSSSYGQVEEMPVVTFHPPTLDPDRAAIKRTIDLAGAAVGLVVTGLLTPLIAIAVRLDSEGPVFFSQQRVGRNGRRFRIHKFRTMHVGAEQMKEELAELNEMEGPIFKVRDDPRVTRVGRWLRRFSLDELPQFWNVLQGEMSLVGTRPPTPEEVEQYDIWHYRRISIRPGITGLWQVSGRSAVTDFQRIVQLDLEYIDNWSLWLDLEILARTALSFARGR